MYVYIHSRIYPNVVYFPRNTIRATYQHSSRSSLRVERCRGVPKFQQISFR